MEIPFGEYANPSFESQVETLSKARPGSPVMSVEAQVEEMWGDSKDDEWKAEEVSRLKAELGIIEVDDEPELNTEGLNMQEEPQTNLLNGAQISSLMNVIKMVKEGNISRAEAISIIVSTLGISKENAESFIENGVNNGSKGNEPPIQNEPAGV